MIGSSTIPRGLMSSANSRASGIGRSRLAISVDGSAATGDAGSPVVAAIEGASATIASSGSAGACDAAGVKGAVSNSMSVMVTPVA